MGQAIFKFDLNDEDDRIDFNLKLKANSYHSILWDIQNEIRRHRKYDVPLEEVFENIEILMQEF